MQDSFFEQNQDTDVSQIIEWFNQVEIQSCISVNSIQDLRNGVALADLTSSWLNKPPLQSIKRNCRDRKGGIQNLSIVLYSLQSYLPKSLLQLTGQQIYDDIRLLVRLIQWLIMQIDPNYYGITPIALQSICNIQNKENKYFVLDQPFSLNNSAIVNNCQNISGLPIQSKQDIHAWLIEQRQINFDLSSVAQQFSNGVQFCDLTNKLEGSRSEVIKGIHRQPKTSSAIQANVNKFLNYLKSLPKMNSKYLWSCKDIMMGKDEVIWGLLQDIKNYYSINKSRSVSRTSKIDRTFNNITPIRLNSQARSFLSPSSQFEDLQINIQPKTTQVDLRKWLAKLGLGHIYLDQEDNSLLNPVNNGILLCKLINAIEYPLRLKYNKCPETVNAAFDNLQKAFRVLSERYDNIPSETKIHDIIKGDQQPVQRILQVLYEIYPTLQLKQHETKYKNLPYNKKQIDKLEKSLLRWISNLEILKLEIKPVSILDIMGLIQSGVLICEIVKRIQITPVIGVFRNPKTDKLKLENIRKAFEALRKIPQMSQMYMQDEKKILQGDYPTVLGLLEDLHRLYDNQPQRKKGLDYHNNGPYITKRFSSLNSSATDINESMRTMIRHKIPGCKNYPKNVEKLDTLSFFKQSHKAHLQFQWINLIQDQQLSNINWEQDCIEEIRSGVLLCRIIEFFERKQLTGVTEPKTTAAALKNIKIFIDFLSKFPNFPSQLMFCEDEILRGDGLIVRKILKAIEKLYKVRIQVIQKFKRQQQSRMSLSKLNKSFV